MPVGGQGEGKSSKDSESGWVSLFDGRRRAAGRPPNSTEGNWKVVDRAPSSARPTCSARAADYKNFRYRAEDEIHNNTGNSGMYFRTAEGPGFPRDTRPRSTGAASPVKTGSI